MFPRSRSGPTSPGSTGSSLQAQLAAATESPRAGEYYAALLPYAGQTVILATAVVCRGPVDHFLGLLARHVAPHAVDTHVEAAGRISSRLAEVGALNHRTADRPPG